MQKRESRVGGYLGIESVQNNASHSNLQMNLDSHIYIGDSNVNLTANNMDSINNLLSSQMAEPV